MNHPFFPAALPTAAVTPAILAQAILRTVAYADVFDYPPTVAEVHRYLEVPATLAQVETCLHDGLLASGRLVAHDGYLTLPGRETIVAVRREREARARLLWPRALAYGRWLAAVPFVRMVALTGSLAVNNPDERSDLDYLLITASGRLWLCRAMVILLVRWAAHRGDTICPNYLLSEQALALAPQDYFVARELTQLVPLYGLAVYHRLRRVNAWTATFLPNADGPPPYPDPAISNGSMTPLPPRLRGLAETVLRLPPTDYLERWEMRRKVAKFRNRYPNQSEALFSADCCKGHFEGHGQRIIAAYHETFKRLNV
ncbi:MAG: hypothetical protein N2383_01420 [Caldilineales bacterium]|nr:hypothetical protein [Caldilineales bacterium]